MRRDKSNQVRVLLDTREDGGPLAVHRNHEKRDEGNKISSFIGIPCTGTKRYKPYNTHPHPDSQRKGERDRAAVGIWPRGP